MAYTWENRIKFIVRYMYDIDNNGYLDKNDFECLAVKNTVVELAGGWTKDKYETNHKIMTNLWNEIAELADFNKDGQVSCEEFSTAVHNVCIGKKLDAFPSSIRAMIEEQFKTVDINGDGSVGLDEFRLDCVNRMAYLSIDVVDDAFNKLCNDADKKAGGLSLARYQELYADFLSSTDEANPAVYLFGPLTPI